MNARMLADNVNRAARQWAGMTTAQVCGAEVALWFLRIAGWLLAATGMAKAFSAAGHARALDTLDPLTGLQFRLLLLLVGEAELLIAFFCLFTERRDFSLVAVAWMSTNLVLYRIGLLLIGWRGPCRCMGSLIDMLHISPRLADNIMKLLLAYLLVGSYATLFWQWRRQRRAEVAPEAFAAPG